MNVTTVGSEQLLLLCQILAVAGDYALGVEHHDVLYLCSQGHVKLGTADGSSTGTIDNNLHVGNVLAGYFEGVLQTCSRDDGCAVLVIVHHWDVECLLQTLFDVEALRRLDVLQVDTAE